MIPLTPPAFTPSPSPSPLVVSSPHPDEGNQEAYFRRVGYPEYRPRFVFSSPSVRINEAMQDPNEKLSSPTRKRKRQSSEHSDDDGNSNKENIPPSKYKRARMISELQNSFLWELLEEDFDRRSRFEKKILEETTAIRRDIEKLVQSLIPGVENGE